MIKQIRQFGLTLCMLVWFGACSTDKAYIVIEPDEVDSLASYYRDTIYIRPNFVCNLVEAKLYSYQTGYPQSDTTYLPLPKNSFVHVYIYKTEEIPGENDWMHFGVYYASVAGKLAPLYNRAKLLEGKYNFYALGNDCIEQDIIPDINRSNGLSNFIYNGEKYYWWNCDSVELVKKDDVQLSIEFETLTTELDFTFIIPDTTWQIKEVLIAAPTTVDASLSLHSGLIQPAKQTSDSLCLQVHNHVAKAILIPFVQEEPLNLKIVVETPDEVVSNYLEVKQPPNALFQGGYIYRYEVDLNQNTVTAY